MSCHRLQVAVALAVVIAVANAKSVSTNGRLGGDTNSSLPARPENDIADFAKIEDALAEDLRTDRDAGETSVGDYDEDEEDGEPLKPIFVSLTDRPGRPKFKQPNKLNKIVSRSAGSSLVLSCAGAGDPLPNVTWTFNDMPLGPTGRYEFKKWSLVVGELRETDSGRYKCALCNAHGCVEHSTKVTVTGGRLGQISVEPLANQTVALNENVLFECRVRSDLEPHIMWVKHEQAGGGPIERLEHELGRLARPWESAQVTRMITALDEPHRLKLGEVQPVDEGWYTCIAANSGAQAMASAYLRVLTPADTSARPLAASKSQEGSSYYDEVDEEGDEVGEEVEGSLWNPIANASAPDVVAAAAAEEEEAAVVVESAPRFKKSQRLVSHVHKPSGSVLQLLCPPVGVPLPNITWTLNGTAISRRIGVVTFKKWAIYMEDVITDDSGVYTCRLCNPHGCIEHSTQVVIFDRLRSKPIISDKFPSNQTVLLHRNATFECRVVTDLEPYIWWIKYRNRVDNISRLEEQIPTRPLNHTADGLHSDIIPLPRSADNPHILKLSNVTHSDEGWYTCVASTNLGISMASAYLRVVDTLPRSDGHTLWRSHPAWVTVAGVVIGAVFLFGSIFIVYVMRKLKHEKLLKHRIETVHQWTKKVIIYKPTAEGGSCGSGGDLQMPVIKIEKQRTTFQTSGTAPANGDPAQAFNEYEFPLDSQWELARSQLTLGSTLGEGAFGRVVMAEASGLPRLTAANNSGSSIVAVKMVKEEHTDADMASLVREMEVMKMIGKHINIINLLGCCSQAGPLWVIVEFAPHGNLKDFLKKNRPEASIYMDEKPPAKPLTEKNLISFAYQIARGMEYLASRRCIHRDLAARNVLVSDNYVMKIADFGLARDIQDTDYYRKNTNGRLPIKWMAPESLQEKFYDSQSDVWSYGVLLWEIMTYGEQPYPHIMSAEELYSYLMTGQRMEKPARCSLNIYMLMRQCWHFDSCARPTFAELVENLDKILLLTTHSAAGHDEYMDLSMPMLETPPSSSDEDMDDDDEDEHSSEPETFQETSPLRYQYTYKFN